MKNISVIVGSIALLINIMLGLMISVYPTFNCLLNSGIIVISILLLYAVFSIKLKDGFRVSFGCLFTICSIIEFVCGLFTPDRLKDNITLILILLLVLAQMVLLLISNYLSKNLK